ncbi:MAG: hypothetical protein SVW02_00330, partial [Candidatus Nanohaloarchaea archaeon]|nr:hypothetical protein [Candidatus Nanohaloarchaea archaeon]
MGKGYCQHGCYPVDKRWHGGSLTGEVDGEEFAINSIFDLREFIRRHGGGRDGAMAAEAAIEEDSPAGEPYVLPDPSDQDDISRKKRGRGISISNIGQGFDYGAHLGIVDHLATYYKFSSPIKVREWVWTSPESQIHDEYVQRKQQAEQQINRILSNLQDLYEQKQLLEHDKRRLEERKAHFDRPDEQEVAGEGYEDELKADFVDLVDQHTGRHSILQMQQNNVFPSITADFYQMTGLDDLSGDGQLADLPENEKAVLRKKWKLYEQWKQQFRTAVESRLQDVNRRLTSVQTSIEQTEDWIRPYVQDIKQIHPDEGTFEEQMDVTEDFSGYLMGGTANFMRRSKLVSNMDRSPGEEENRYRDVVIFRPFHAGTPNFEQPQQAGGGLIIYKMQFKELLVCEHVWQEVFQPQIEAKKNEVRDFIQQYVGEDVDISGQRSDILDRYGEVLTDEERERVENAESRDQLHQVEIDINQRLDNRVRRWKDRVRGFFGLYDEFHHEDPSELR